MYDWAYTYLSKCISACVKSNKHRFSTFAGPRLLDPNSKKSIKNNERRNLKEPKEPKQSLNYRFNQNKPSGV